MKSEVSCYLCLKESFRVRIRETPDSSLQRTSTTVTVDIVNTLFIMSALLIGT